MYLSPIAKGHGWVRHNKGGCELLGTRGPSILDDGLGRSLFLRYRVTGLWSQLVFEGLRTLNRAPPYTATGSKKPLCFTDPTLRRVSRTANETYHDFLIEEMLDIPELLQDIDSLPTYEGTTERQEHTQRLLSRAVMIMKKLDDWFCWFRVVHPYPYTWALSTNDEWLGPTRHGAFFPQRLEFVNLLVAQTMVHYWAAMVIILRSLVLCQDILARNHQAPQQYEHDKQLEGEDIEASAGESMPSELRDRALWFADCICYSAEYCVSKDQGAAGPVVLLFPLWIAKDLYADEGDQLSHGKEAFCAGIFQEMTSRGMHISKRLVVLSTKDQVEARK
jgi:hypothetical protein